MMLGGKSGWLPQGHSGTGEEGYKEVLHKPRPAEWGREEKDVMRREVSKASSTTSSGARGRRAPRHSWANEASAQADRRHLLPPSSCRAPGSRARPPTQPGVPTCAAPASPGPGQECPRQGQLCREQSIQECLQTEKPLCRDGAGTFAPKRTRAPL